MDPFAIIGLIDSGAGTFWIWLPGGQKARSIAPLFKIRKMHVYIKQVSDIYKKNMVAIYIGFDRLSPDPDLQINELIKNMVAILTI